MWWFGATVSRILRLIDWFTFVLAISFVASHINRASSSSAVTNESVQVLSTEDIRKSLSLELIKFVQRMESELTVPNNLNAQYKEYKY